MPIVKLVFDHYAWSRPHQGLAGATPAEIYLGKRLALLEAVLRPSRSATSITSIACHTSFRKAA